MAINKQHNPNAKKGSHQAPFPESGDQRHFQPLLQLPIRVEMRFLGGELLPYEIGINDGLGGYDESHKIHDSRQGAPQAQHDAGKQSDRHAVGGAFFIGLHDHVLRNFPYTRDCISDPVRKLVTDFFQDSFPPAPPLHPARRIVAQTVSAVI